jgi:hypothetical protein
MQSDDSRASSSLSSASSSSSSSTVTSSPKTASYLLEAIDKQGKHALHYIDNLLGYQGFNSAKVCCISQSLVESAKLPLTFLLLFSNSTTQ